MPVSIIDPAPIRAPRKCDLVFVVVSIVLAFALTSLPAQAEQESCDQCKYLRCLKSTVKRKQALIEVYAGLRDFWSKRATDVNGKPLTVQDLHGYAEPQRSRVYEATLEQLREFAVMEEQRTSRIPTPEGCGYGESEQSAATDSFESCTTSGLGAVQAQQPCQEMADLLAAHEGMHARACKERQRPSQAYWPYTVHGKNGQTVTRYFPPKMITPAGKAAEEIAAYQFEIAALQKMIDKLEKKCVKVEFKNVTLDCVMGSGPNVVHMGQILAGQACGDPTKAIWTIKQINFVRAPGMPAMPPNTDTFDTDCVAAGGEIERHYANVHERAGPNAGGWFCVYRDQPKPQITLRNYRPSVCAGPREQRVTVDAIIKGPCEDNAPATPAPTPRPPVS